MKKLFLGSIALLTFSFSIVIFQASCKKDAVAQTTNYVLPPATTSTLGGVIVGSGLSVSSNGTLSVNPPTTAGVQQLGKIIFIKSFETSTSQWGEIWMANYDGTNQTKINITIPSGYSFEGAEQHVKLSPDGQTLFFDLNETGTTKSHIFSCKADGSNVKKVIDGTGTNLDFITVQGAY